MGMLYNRIKIVLIIVLLFYAITMISFQTVLSSEAESDVCMECHDIAQNMAKSEHMIGRLVADGNKIISCMSCHTNASEHIDDPTDDNIDNPANMKSFDVSKICENCHIAHNSASNIGYSTHSAIDISCVDCHTLHLSDDAGPTGESSELCVRCHSDVIDDMQSRTHHPFLEKNIRCLDCHQEYSKTNLDQTFRTYNCSKCHFKQANPHLYEHEVVMGYSVEGDGCSTCHAAHGSENNFLLSQPSNQLCEQCHFPANHLTAHSGDYANQSCVVCHSEIHGSNYNRYLLDKSMPAKFGLNCYETGCHALFE